MGGFITDLDPSQRWDSQILYGVNESLIAVWFHEIPVFGDTSDPPFYYDFTILMHQDGRIELRYVNVQPHYHSLVGLRRPLLSDMDETNREKWHTKINGTYPHPDQVVSNHTLEFCSIETNYCMTSALDTEGGYIHLLPETSASQALSCLLPASNSNHFFKCMFTAQDDPSVTSNSSIIYNQELMILSCFAPGGVGFHQVEIYDEGTEQYIRLDQTLEFEYVSNSGDYYLPSTPEPCGLYYDPAAQDSTVDSTTSDWSSLSDCSELIEHVCGMCSSHNPSICYRDCDQQWRGEARLDNCLQCTEGATGKTFNQDLNCQGLCFGPDYAEDAMECVCKAWEVCENFETVNLTTLKKATKNKFKTCVNSRIT